LGFFGLKMVLSGVQKFNIWGPEKTKISILDKNFQ
jgi:hypothetical protein